MSITLDESNLHYSRHCSEDERIKILSGKRESPVHIEKTIFTKRLTVEIDSNCFLCIENCTFWCGLEIRFLGNGGHCLLGTNGYHSSGGKGYFLDFSLFNDSNSIEFSKGESSFIWRGDSSFIRDFDRIRFINNQKFVILINTREIQTLDFDVINLPKTKPISLVFSGAGSFSIGEIKLPIQIELKSNIKIIKSKFDRSLSLILRGNTLSFEDCVLSQSILDQSVFDILDDKNSRIEWLGENRLYLIGKNSLITNGNVNFHGNLDIFLTPESYIESGLEKISSETRIHLLEDGNYKIYNAGKRTTILATGITASLSLNSGSTSLILNNTTLTICDSTIVSLGTLDDYVLTVSGDSSTLTFTSDDNFKAINGSNLLKNLSQSVSITNFNANWIVSSSDRQYDFSFEREDLFKGYSLIRLDGDAPFSIKSNQPITVSTKNYDKTLITKSTFSAGLTVNNNRIFIFENCIFSETDSTKDLITLIDTNEKVFFESVTFILQSQQFICRSLELIFWGQPRIILTAGSYDFSIHRYYEHSCGVLLGTNEGRYRLTNFEKYLKIGYLRGVDQCVIGGESDCDKILWSDAIIDLEQDKTVYFRYMNIVGSESQVLSLASGNLVLDHGTILVAPDQYINENIVLGQNVVIGLTGGKGEYDFSLNRKFELERGVTLISENIYIFTNVDKFLTITTGKKSHIINCNFKISPRIILNGTTKISNCVFNSNPRCCLELGGNSSVEINDCVLTLSRSLESLILIEDSANLIIRNSVRVSLNGNVFHHGIIATTSGIIDSGELDLETGLSTGNPLFWPTLGQNLNPEPYNCARGYMAVDWERDFTVNRDKSGNVDVSHHEINFAFGVSKCISTHLMATLTVKEIEGVKFTDIATLNKQNALFSSKILGGIVGETGNSRRQLLPLKRKNRIRIEFTNSKDYIGNILVQLVLSCDKGDLWSKVKFFEYRFKDTLEPNIFLSTDQITICQSKAIFSSVVARIDRTFAYPVRLFPLGSDIHNLEYSNNRLLWKDVSTYSGQIVIPQGETSTEFYIKAAEMVSDVWSTSRLKFGIFSSDHTPSVVSEELTVTNSNLDFSFPLISFDGRSFNGSSRLVKLGVDEAKINPGYLTIDEMTQSVSHIFSFKTTDESLNFQFLDVPNGCQVTITRVTGINDPTPFVLDEFTSDTIHYFKLTAILSHLAENFIFGRVFTVGLSIGLKDKTVIQWQILPAVIVFIGSSSNLKEQIYTGKTEDCRIVKGRSHNIYLTIPGFVDKPTTVRFNRINSNLKFDSMISVPETIELSPGQFTGQTSFDVVDDKRQWEDMSCGISPDFGGIPLRTHAIVKYVYRKEDVFLTISAKIGNSDPQEVRVSRENSEKKILKPNSEIERIKFVATSSFIPSITKTLQDVILRGIISSSHPKAKVYSTATGLEEKTEVIFSREKIEIGDSFYLDISNCEPGISIEMAISFDHPETGFSKSYPIFLINVPKFLQNVVQGSHIEMGNWVLKPCQDGNLQICRRDLTGEVLKPVKILTLEGEWI